MAFRSEYIYYLSPNMAIDQTVYVNIKRNNVEVATGITLQQVDRYKQQGAYVYTLTDEVIRSFGGAGTYEAYASCISDKIRDATIFKMVITEFNMDDIEAHLKTQDALLSTVNGGIVTTNGTLQNANYGLQAAYNLLTTVQKAIGNIQNNTSFSSTIPTLLLPEAGFKTVEIPISIFSSSGAVGMEDPDNNQVLVQIKDASGKSWSSNLTDYVSTQDGAYAKRNGLGDYVAVFRMASDMNEEFLTFTYSYVENGTKFVQKRTSATTRHLTNMAQQDSLLTASNDIKSVLALLNDGTKGLDAAKKAIDLANSIANTDHALLVDSNIGLKAIKDLLVTTASQSSLTDLHSKVDVMWSYIQSNLYRGGRLV